MNDNQTINVTAQLDTAQIKNALKELEVSIKPIKISIELDTKKASTVETLFQFIKESEKASKAYELALKGISTAYHTIGTTGSKSMALVLDAMTGSDKAFETTIDRISSGYKIITTSATKVVTTLDTVHKALSAFQTIGNHQRYALLPQAA